MVDGTLAHSQATDVRVSHGQNRYGGLRKVDSALLQLNAE